MTQTTSGSREVQGDGGAVPVAVTGDPADVELDLDAGSGGRRVARGPRTLRREQSRVQRSRRPGNRVLVGARPLAAAVAVLAAMGGLTSWYSEARAGVTPPVDSALLTTRIQSPSPTPPAPLPVGPQPVDPTAQPSSKPPPTRATTRKGQAKPSRTARSTPAAPLAAASSATGAVAAAPVPGDSQTGIAPVDVPGGSTSTSTAGSQAGTGGSTGTGGTGTSSSTGGGAEAPTQPAPAPTTQIAPPTTQAPAPPTTRAAPPTTSTAPAPTTDSGPTPGGAGQDTPVNVTRSFYVDCNGGSDSGTGRSTSDAWQTLGRVGENGLTAGDGLFLKRGCSWDGGLLLRSSGTANNPILISAYGSGAAPSIRNTNSYTYSSAIELHGNYVVVDGLSLQDAHFAGVRFWDGTSHNTVRNSEVSNTGLGVVLGGSFHLATKDKIHDLHMVLNTPGGNDDYGAVGFEINGTDDEVSYSTCTNCQASSYDFGHDGGFVEVWNSGDRANIHHNYARTTNGFFELGAEDSSHHANGVRVNYNVIDNDGISINVNRSNSYSIGVDDFRFENNTVVQTGSGAFPAVIFPQVTPQQFISRNNIYYLSGYPLVAWYGSGSFSHNNNLYYLANGAAVGFTLDSSERVADPKFANLGAGDYHLASGSPAIGAGANLGYSTDIAGNAVNGTPAIGAYQP